MATREELLYALRAADAAGDTAAAQAIAQRLAGSQGGSPTQLAPIQPAGNAPFQRAGTNAGWGLDNTTAASAGINDAVIKTGLGIKSLFTDLSEDDKYALKGMRQEKEEDPEGFKRGAGEFVGNVLIGAVPGAKLASMGSKAVGVGKAFAPYFGTSLGAAGTEFVQHPAEGEGAAERMTDKLTSAGQAAVLAPLMQLGLRSVGKGLTQWFKPTPEAAKLMAQDFNPTLQQGAESGFGRFVGGLTSGVVDVKKRLRDELGNAWTSRVTNGLDTGYKEGTAEDFLKAAQNHVGNELTEFWKGHKVNLSPKAVKAIAKKAGVVLSNNRQLRDAMEAKGIVMDLLGDGSVNLRLKYDTFAEQVRNPLSTKMREATSEGVRERISSARDLMDKLVTRAGRSVGDVEKLQDINKRVFDVKRAEEAVTPLAYGQEGLDVNALARAYAKNLPQAAKVGNTTYQELVQPATRIIGNSPTQHRSRALLTVAKQLGAPAAAVLATQGALPTGVGLAALLFPSLIGQTGKGAKFLMGGNKWQQETAKILQQLGPAAQALYTGAATSAEEKE